MATVDLNAATPQLGASLSHAPRLAAVDSGYRSILRLQIALSGALVIALVLLADFLFVRQPFITTRTLAAALATAWALAVIFLPDRRFRALGYSLSADEFHVTKGVRVHTYTIVPVWRIQHIDVAQDPLARWLGLATLVMHTAGTLSSSVAVPGLHHGEAERLRNVIREAMRRDRP